MPGGGAPTFATRFRVPIPGNRPPSPNSAPRLTLHRALPDVAAGSVRAGKAGQERGVMGAPALVNGQLPLGRWVCSLADVEAAYVPADDGDPRRGIWNQWHALTMALRDVVGEIAACWLSGSFFSDKPVPGDMDCLYVIDTDHIAAVAATGDKGRIAFLQAASVGAIKELFGIDVDSYVLEWVPTPGYEPPVGASQYLAYRGYWDDLWIRVKDSDARLDSIPRRGYLEVIIDGYR